MTTMVVKQSDTEQDTPRMEEGNTDDLNFFEGVQDGIPEGGPKDELSSLKSQIAELQNHINDMKTQGSTSNMSEKLQKDYQSHYASWEDALIKDDKAGMHESFQKAIESVIQQYELGKDQTAQKTAKETVATVKRLAPFYGGQTPNDKKNTKMFMDVASEFGGDPTNSSFSNSDLETKTKLILREMKRRINVGNKTPLPANRGGTEQIEGVTKEEVDLLMQAFGGNADRSKISKMLKERRQRGE